jgi:hypothetical protein
MALVILIFSKENPYDSARNIVLGRIYFFASDL